MARGQVTRRYRRRPSSLANRRRFRRRRRSHLRTDRTHKMSPYSGSPSLRTGQWAGSHIPPLTRRGRSTPSLATAVRVHRGWARRTWPARPSHPPSHTPGCSPRRTPPLLPHRRRRPSNCRQSNTPLRSVASRHTDWGYRYRRRRRLSRRRGCIRQASRPRIPYRHHLGRSTRTRRLPKTSM